MKAIAVSLALLVSVGASASSLVCAGPTVHYSRGHADGGPKPPKGMKIGEAFVAIQGSLKAHQFYYAEEPPQGEWNIKLDLLAQETLAEKVDSTGSWKVYRAKLSVKSADGSMTLAQEAVTCRNEVLFIP
jgi:hypothetical protein